MAEMTAIETDLGNGIYKKQYSNGNTYEGQLKDGKPHGRGIMTFPDGKVYDGGWVDNSENGLTTTTKQTTTKQTTTKQTTTKQTTTTTKQTTTKS